MSTIFGKFYTNKKPVATQELIKMQDRLNHWNADDKGIWQSEQVGMGHLMLWNTPESLQEKPPYQSPYSKNVIVADARIDYRDELIAKFGIMPDSLTDSALILAAYEKWGEGCVKHLYGDFAFVIWDARKQQLFCARDQIGVRPFFYYHDEHCFVWASEMKGIFEHLGGKPAYDPHYIKMVLHLARNENHATPYTSIKMLRPGHYMTLSNNQLDIRQYWDLDIHRTVTEKTDQDYFERVRSLFYDAIQQRMRTAFPLGSQLSGGLDSSGIAAIAHRFSKQRNSKFYSFTYVTTDAYKKMGKFDEREDAQKVIKHIGIENPVFIASSSGLSYMEYLERELAIVDGPYQGLLAFMMFDLGIETQSRNIRTVLSGHNGDLIVTAKAKGYIAEHIKKHRYGAAIRAIQSQHIGNPIFNIFRFLKQTAVAYFGEYLPVHYGKKRITLKDQFVSSKIIEQKKQRVRIMRYPSDVRKYQYKVFHWAGGNSRCFIENIMMKPVKAEMTYPMFDVKLIEYCLALPVHLKVRDGVNRYFYRRMMEDILPNDILWGKKNGGLSSPSLQQIYDDDLGQINSFLKKNMHDSLFERIDYQLFSEKIQSKRERLDGLHPVTFAHPILLLLKDKQSLSK